jgi:hypothetical protein
MHLNAIIRSQRIKSIAAFSSAILLTCYLNFYPQKAVAQACCSGGVPLSGILGIGLGSSEYKSLQLMLTYDYNKLSTLMTGTQVLEDQIRQRTTQSTILEINYGLSKRLTITGILPYIKQSRTITSFDGNKINTSTNGLGDALFLLKYSMLNPQKFTDWSILSGGGIKLPSGRTDYKSNDGFILVADMQPGSGSVDGILWFYIQKNKFLLPNLSLLSVTTYRISGVNNSYNTSQSYQFGNEFQTNLGLNLSLFAKIPFNVFSFLRYRSQAIDLLDQNTYPGSGGKWVYLIPGINIDLSTACSFRVTADIPLYRNLNGTQLTTSYKFTSSILYRFPSKKKIRLLNNPKI